MSEQRRKELYAEIDGLVAELQELVRVENADGDDVPETVVDWVLVAGFQFFEENGDRVGGVSIFPRGGSQPAYLTVGLLHEAAGKYL